MTPPLVACKRKIIGYLCTTARALNFYITMCLYPSGDRRSMGQELRNLSMECPALLRIREIFGLENLEFSILLREREDEDRIVVNRSSIDSREQV